MSSKNEEPSFFDFKAEPEIDLHFARGYLEQYYRPDRLVTNDEKVVIEFIADQQKILNRGGSAIEVACGPTMHHALMIAPYVDALDMSDYLEGNLAEVRAWINKEPGMWGWQNYTNAIIASSLSKSIASASEYEDQLRKKIRSVQYINLLDKTPLGKVVKYDLVTAFYCTEEVGVSYQGWQQILVHVSSLVKKGGYLLMTCLRETNYYHIVGAKGHVRKLPAAYLTLEVLKETLAHCGFDTSGGVVESVNVSDQAEEGVTGVLLSLCRKVT